jgi:Mrp family chromosome partitioning ATPase
MADMATKKNTAEKDVVAYNSALKNIESHFSPENRKYFESSLSGINAEIVNVKDQLKLANEAYVQNGFNAKDKAKIDSLQSKLTRAIYAQTDNYTSNPNATKDNLVGQKLNLEVSRDLAQNSVQTLDNEWKKLNGNLQRLVPNLASIQNYNAKIETANKEYQDILQKYNQASLEANFSSPVRIAERAVPGDAAPNKNIIMVVLSSVSSLILCIFVLFAMFYFDNTIRSSAQLENIADISVLGSLNLVQGNFLNLHEVWTLESPDLNSTTFKNSLRSIRHEIENNMQQGNNILAITSLNEGEGKTFFAESLAYAFSRMNKKVLIIDGNFMHPDISTTFNGPNYIEKFLTDSSNAKMVDNEFITIIGNKGGDGSLMELNTGKNIKDFFAVLKSIYDVIIIETSAMDGLNQANAKEWISFAEKVVVVFESGQKLDQDGLAHIEYLKQQDDKLMGMVMNKVANSGKPMKFTKMIDRPKNEEATTYC